MPTTDVIRAQADQLFQQFFVAYLADQRGLSPRTLSAYRDTFRLFLQFLQRTARRRSPPGALDLLQAEQVLRFLKYLERERHNTVRTRNARLAAIHALARYALTLWAGPAAVQTRRVLAVPFKRYTRPLVGFLSRREMTALLQVPAANWSGRRDRLLFTLLYNTGARVSEIIGLRVRDGLASQFRHLELHGKGRKQRAVPLWKNTRRLLRQWIKENRLAPDAPLFTNRRGQPLTRFGVYVRLQQRVQIAHHRCPTLRQRRISPHTLRHTTAMHLLQAGVMPEVISLWLGHESPNTTHLYVEADLAMKEKALRRLRSPNVHPVRFQAKGSLLRFLERL